MFVAEEQIQKDPTKAHLLVCRDMGNTNPNLCKQFYPPLPGLQQGNEKYKHLHLQAHRPTNNTHIDTVVT
jgi:hypothetical protein